MSNQFKKLLNSKVIGIRKNEIYFDNGYVLNCHEYETYMCKYEKNELKQCQYYSPKYVEEV